MSVKYRNINTTVRFDEETSAMIYHLMEISGASQSNTIRQLVSAGLGKQKIVLPKTTVLSDEAKQLILGIYDRQADIKNELNRIGNNINVKRRQYNATRKSIEERITVCQKLAKQCGSYDRIKYANEINKLQEQLNEFDSKETNFIEITEWEKFKEILSEFYRISYDIERRLSW